LTSYNWISFGAWEFHTRCRAGYLGDVDFFTRELDKEDEYDGEGEYKDDGEDEDDDVQVL
jgi:hypothetical protein